MIDYEFYCKLRHLKDHEGLSAHQIAEELAMDPRTVAKWLARERFCQRKAVPRSSKLDPFKAEITRWLQSHAFTAAQILVRIREQGYAGGYSIVKDYVRAIRPQKRPAYLTLAFAPGECAQVDWGSYGSVIHQRGIRSRPISDACMLTNRPDYFFQKC
jgi:transposase